MRYSVAAVADENGRVLAAHRSPGEPLSFHTTPRVEFRSRIKELLRSVTSRLGLNLASLKDATICLGITGVTFPFDALVDLPREFQELEINCHRLICTGDAETIVASHVRAATGSAIVCHMGSTAYLSIEKPRRSLRYGGWGPAIGDEGSGFALGRGAFRLIGEEFDSGVPGDQSILWRRVREWLESPPGDVPEWTEASLRWRDYAELFAKYGCDLRTSVFALAHEAKLSGSWRVLASGAVVPLMLAWRDGHEPSGRLVHAAASDLVDQYARACNAMKLTTAINPVVLYGGVLVHNPDFRELVSTSLRERFGQRVDVIGPWTHGSTRPVIGALLFALGKSTTGHLNLPSTLIADRVFATAAAREYREALRND